METNQSISGQRYRWSLNPRHLDGIGSYRDKFEIAGKAGFEGVELRAVSDPDIRKEIDEAAKATGIVIHSVLNRASWSTPVSSNNPEIVSKGIKETINALENARYWGADTILFHAGMMASGENYKQAHDRFREVIRQEILPVAEEFGVVLALENVWNGYLLSPLEYARFIEDFNSDWIKPYIDVGNLFFSPPEQWIQAAGKGVIKLHAKDFKINMRWRNYEFSRLGQGDVNWAAVRKALDEVGFSGWANYAVPDGVLSRGIRYVKNKWGKKKTSLRSDGIPGIRNIRKYQALRYLLGAIEDCQAVLH